MGLLQEVASHPVAQQLQQLGLGSQIAIVLASIVGLAVALNVANQLFFKNPNEPPMVFHWFPFIGNTITYGMDPPKFFKENRAKVSQLLILPVYLTGH
jgi:sterol 14alpha-demethylase